jgi:5-methyltetrahydrofolate--homocysteine methyltransferase
MPTTPKDQTSVLLERLAAERVLLLDGAMGTMVQRYKLVESDYQGKRFATHPHDVKGNNELLTLTRPDVISAIHHEYLDAGSDIIETNTFGATAIAQADYKLESVVYEMNVEAARLAKIACAEWTKKTPNRPRFVAGALGPMNRTLSISPDVNDPSKRSVTFEQVRLAYAEQVRGLDGWRRRRCSSPRPSSTPSTPRPPSRRHRRSASKSAAKRVPIMI